MPLSSLTWLLRRAALAAGVMLIAACAGSSRSGGSPRLALVIGNAAYQNAPALNNPVNDAADMCKALRGVGFTTLCHTNLRDRAEFEARVKDYVERLGPTTVGVVFYSGHGVQAGNANFLIPTQAEPKTAAEDPLRVLYGIDELFARLRARPTRLQLVMLDACRTDLLAAPRQPAGRGPNSNSRSGLLRSLDSVARVGSGLAPIQDAPPGTMVLYATASKEAAYDGDGRNGPLTKHILQHIGTHGVPLAEFFHNVTNGVANETARAYGKRQTPFIYGSPGERFCFAGCPGETVVPPAL